MKWVPVKIILSKWLVIGIILLGFFTFSGLTIQIPKRLDKPCTTLVAGYANKASKSIPYSAALKGVNRIALSILISGVCSLLALSFLHSRQAQTMLAQASTLFITNKQIKYIFFISAYSNGLVDDSHLSVG
jgi:hypothetical protein